MTDARGYTLDLGYRGKVKDYLSFDVSGYYMQYNDRVGTIAQQHPDGTFYNLRTNVGDSRSIGMETYIEFNPVKAFYRDSRWGTISVFASVGYNEARYETFKVVNKVGNSLVETSLEGKRVENAPRHIQRYGLTYTYRGFSLTGQMSYVSDAYADANNTVKPTANGQNGLIPSYTVTDVSTTVRFLKHYNIRAGVNNLTDARYFTRRAGGYPGPGLLPAEARNFFISLGVKL
jgi:Fe(3+) dicitrate transport protein